MIAVFDAVATLRSLVRYDEDEALNQVPVYEDREVFVRPRSVYANEFYQAANSGLKPAVVLVLPNFADYNGEKVVLFEGREYTVLRTYQTPDRDALELTLEERIENGA